MCETNRQSGLSDALCFVNQNPPTSALALSCRAKPPSGIQREEVQTTPTMIVGILASIPSLTHTSVTVKLLECNHHDLTFGAAEPWEHIPSCSWPVGGPYVSFIG